MSRWRKKWYSVSTIEVLGHFAGVVSDKGGRVDSEGEGRREEGGERQVKQEEREEQLRTKDGGGHLKVL